MSSPLHLDVFVVPYKPITGLIPPMSKGEATWPATSVSLVTGERDAVLIDAALTPEDAEQIKLSLGQGFQADSIFLGPAQVVNDALRHLG